MQPRDLPFIRRLIKGVIGSFIYLLADWLILACDIIRSRCALIFDGHNPDVTALKQPDFIVADLFSTGRNARNRDFCSDHFRSLELVRTDGIWLAIELVQRVRLAESPVFIEADVVTARMPRANNLLGGCC